MAKYPWEKELPFAHTYTGTFWKIQQPWARNKYAKMVEKARAVLAKINDQNKLVDICISIEYRSVGKWYDELKDLLIPRITDEQCIHRLVTESEHLYYTEIAKVKDKNCLLAIARSDKYSNYTNAAFEQLLKLKMLNESDLLVDNAKLLNLALATEHFWGIRESVIQVLTNQSKLTELAKEEADIRISFMAAMRLYTLNKERGVVLLNAVVARSVDVLYKNTSMNSTTATTMFDDTTGYLSEIAKIEPDIIKKHWPRIFLVFGGGSPYGRHSKYLGEFPAFVKE